MKTFPEIPDELMRHAFAVGNGELFWPLSAAGGVAEAIAAAGLGIVGGEVYVAQGRAWGNMDLEWVTEPDPRDGEPWAAYVERGLEQARSALDEAHETLVPRSSPDREPMCFLAFRAEGESRVQR